MTESREEAKTRLRGFVEEYVALCNKYQAELETWREGKEAHFFETQDEALEYLKSLFAKVSKAI